MNPEELTVKLIKVVLQALEDEVYSTDDLSCLVEELSALEDRVREFNLFKDSIYSFLNNINERVAALENVK